jgi:hypothetical protein
MATGSRNNRRPPAVGLIVAVLAALVLAGVLATGAAAVRVPQPNVYPVEPGGYGCFQAYGSLTPRWPGVGKLYFNPRFCANGYSVTSVDPSWRGCYGGGWAFSQTTCNFTTGPYVVAGCVGCGYVTYQFGGQFTNQAPWPYGYTEYRVINCKMTRYGEWWC